MAQTEHSAEKTGADATLEGGTYEIIRNRLLNHGKALRERLEKLDGSRREIFGAIEQTLLATERITTRHNCVPRDMVSVNGTRFVFGYNVHMGLKTEIQISDVFSVYQYKERQFRQLPWEVLDSGRFEEDLKNLYKYYKDTRFIKFSVIGPHLYMVFRVSKSSRDIKAFKWLIQDSTLTYMDNRSDHEVRFPGQHDFEWTRTTRDDHRPGSHPHVSVRDRVFVETVGGDITFKVEDNTEIGQGIYAEPVENPDQTLDDAEIAYAVMGHIILVRIRPYQEARFRYFIYNDKTRTVCRADDMEQACVQLPDDQGLIFSNGYYLESGELRRFESGMRDMMFESRIASPNGEDFLYVFYDQESGNYALLSYNLIRQQVETPLPCNGFSLFDSGEMILFRADREPVRHHVIQVWQTPYMSGEHAFAEKSDAFLYKVGNPDIVRCMAECNTLIRLINREDLYAALYVDMVKKARDIADAYFWIDNPEAFNLREVLSEIRKAASGAVDEFEKVVRLKKSTADAVARVTDRSREILDRAAPEYMESIDDFVRGLAALRGVRGEIISLGELRHVDTEAVARLDREVSEAVDRMSGLCVEFLLKPEALGPYEARVAEAGEQVESLSRVTDASALQEKTEAASEALEMLIEIVSNLKIEDATQTTRIIDNISAIYSRLNQVRAALKNKKKRLQSIEGVAQFNAQMKLLSQSVINYIDICDTPEKCDEYLTKIMISVEELEGRFADFDEFIGQISEKRDEVYAAFESKKLALAEARNRRATALMDAAERILRGVQNRVATLEEVSAINAYFASDLMIEKVRDIVTQLLEISDTVKADDIQSRLKTIREDTVRQLKDRKELYAEGENIIRFGNHSFSVNTQPLDLTMVLRDGVRMFHLTGTDFFEPVADAAFEATRPVWDMAVISEDKTVYRGEYLAFQMLRAFEAEDGETRTRFGAFSDAEWEEHTRTFMGQRYAEGYVKGVHDRDAAKLCSALVAMHGKIGLLRFSPRARALARLFWHIYFQAWSDETARNLMADKLAAFGAMTQIFPGPGQQENYVAELETMLADFAEKVPLFPDAPVPEAARYLFCELSGFETDAGDEFVISTGAWAVAEGLLSHLRAEGCAESLEKAREKVARIPASEFELVRDWVAGYAATLPAEKDLSDYVDEASVLIFTRNARRMNMPEVSVSADIEGMAGDHPVIREGRYHLNYNRFSEKLSWYEGNVVPRFREYTALRKQLTDEMRETLRLSEFKPRVLTSFVRNRLIDQVYLPLVGDNLAKQIGVAGEGKRTDRMGMLLLISPPGYGKTTLMEYISNRLGIIFMKINGPAIGYQVTSLDPAEAPNASAREEVEKISLALEMGDNVMIYLDDIQHCNPELLQKFISLCDAQRKIEGVYKGRTRTYDLRGKKVAVVMAGNPYTESGEKFRIPDMLANRADTYNLGDIIGDTAEAFKLSYLENALTSNPVLSPLTSRSRKDIHSIMRIAESGDREGIEFDGNYSAEELNEMVSVMEKLITVREVILRVNLEYIRSAAQADEYRTEPPFRLQGSYRNMNRLAERIVPIMNPEEVKTLLLSHYENEAQTLTTGAEANLLKFKKLTGWMDAAETARWAEICRMFKKNQLLRGMDDRDPVTQVVGQLSAFYDGLEGIRGVLASAMKQTDRGMTRIAFAEETLGQLAGLVSAVRAVAASSAKAEKEETPADPVLPPKLEVVNRMPDGYLELVKAQFEMMDAWMEPTFKATRQQAGVLQKLGQEIGNLKAVYQEIIHARQEGGWQDIEKFDVALRVNPKDHKSYYKRGLAWYNKNKVSRALSDFKNALDLQPKNKKYQRIVAHLEAELTTDKGEGENYKSTIW
ncbi:AAA family ATPase [Desulfonema ishimotonii]|uniref:AAA family ATPase n=1 Tax=Desulfonema ishimotonii TaxID=45657 RepID=A0A401G3W4_9BACT|nr:DNA repair ATPase [Desulfonema ishimotonii]GBC63906.1 AAA family ATPase [Desulfonema ishimotonii]